jgi:LuxR family maltose regulon positive regulatory protein
MGELTNREIEVLRLLGRRLSNKEIAEQLHVSPNTIKKYSINVYKKLEVSNRRQAVARAVELGIIPGT